MNNDETMVIMTKKQAKQRRRFLGVPLPVAAVVGAVLAFGGAAVAAALIDSEVATAEVKAGQVAKLKFEGVKVDKPLFPGTRTGIEFTIVNPNPFTVKVDKAYLHGTPEVKCEFPGDEKYLTRPGKPLNNPTLTLNTTVAANGKTPVSAGPLLELSNEAKGGCSVKVSFKVSGEGAPVAGE